MEKYPSIVLCVDLPDCLRHLALDGARADCGHEAPGGRRARRRVDVGEVILNTVQVRYITSRHVFRGVSCLTDQCCNEYSDSDSDSNLFLRILNIRIRIRDFCKTNNIRIRICNRILTSESESF